MFSRLSPISEDDIRKMIPNSRNVCARSYAIDTLRDSAATLGLISCLYFFTLDITLQHFAVQRRDNFCHKTIGRHINWIIHLLLPFHKFNFFTLCAHLQQSHRYILEGLVLLSRLSSKTHYETRVYNNVFPHFQSSCHLLQ